MHFMPQQGLVMTGEVCVAIEKNDIATEKNDVAT